MPFCLLTSRWNIISFYLVSHPRDVPIYSPLRLPMKLTSLTDRIVFSSHRSSHLLSDIISKSKTISPACPSICLLQNTWHLFFNVVKVVMALQLKPMIAVTVFRIPVSFQTRSLPFIYNS